MAGRNERGEGRTRHRLLHQPGGFPATFPRKQGPKAMEEEEEMLTLPPARSSRPDRRRKLRSFPRQGEQGVWKYVGVPLLGMPLASLNFNFLLDKVATEIASWKWKALSLAGRTTSLQLVLSSIPICCISCVSVPLSINTRLDKELSGFVLWGHTSDRRGLHLVS